MATGSTPFRNVVITETLQRSSVMHVVEQIIILPKYGYKFFLLEATTHSTQHRQSRVNSGMSVGFLAFHDS